MRPVLFRKQSITRLSNVRAVIRYSKESGAALIVSLLLLILMSILGIGMVLAVSSDVWINGYYGNYRSSFYAADSGLNVIRQQLTNKMILSVNTASCSSWGPTGACTSYPITNAATAATNALASVMSTYSSFTALKDGQSAQSWPGNFALSNQSTFTLYSSPTATCGATSSSPCIYTFQYNLIALGKGPGVQQVQTSEAGFLNVSVVATGSTGTTNFSQFGAFINNFAADSSPLVYGTLTGKQWTNGSWNFGSGGTYTFTDTVYEGGPTVSYDFTGNYCNPYCYKDSSSSSYSYNNQTIAPTFQGGIVMNAGTASMPTDAYSQQYAVLDGIGQGETTSLTTAMTQDLRNASNTAYATGVTSGVYLSTTDGANVTGGGIYVEGSVTSIVLTPGTDINGNLTQSYQIVQGNTTTTITTNPGANTTTMSSVTNGITTTRTLSGVPHSSTGTVQTILYVDGNIGPNYSSSLSNSTGLSGPNPSNSNESTVAGAAIQDGVKLTIVANGDINVVGNLMYKEEPVTTNTSDALIPANDKGQVLGLFTPVGDIVLNSPYNDNNLEIDGAIAAVGATCTQSGMANNCGLETIGQIGTFTIVGGRSEANAHGVNMSKSNTYYDKRFMNGTAPPWFPSTTISGGIAGPPQVTSTYSKLNWQSTNQN